MLCINSFRKVKANIVQAAQNGTVLDLLYEILLIFAPGTLILSGLIAQEMRHALKVKDIIMKDL
jgi:hypothetical protein